jgi:hypothetical protein
MQMVYIRRIAANKFVLPVQPPQHVGALRQASHVLFKISAPVSPLPMPLPTREMSPSNKETKMHSRIQTEKLFCSEYGFF